MSRVMKTSDLIDSVRDRAFVPKEDAVYNDDRIIKILNEQIDARLLPKLMSTKEELLVVSESVETDSESKEYDIPYRAVGNKLRDAALRDGGNNYYELSRISLEELSDYRWNNSYGAKGLFYLESNQLKLVSSVAGDYDYLEMWFYLRPNVLVKDDLVPTIKSIDTVNGVVTLSTFPSAFSDASLFDFVGAKSPNKILGYDTPPTSISRSSKTVVFAPEDLPKKLSVGDYLAVSEESCVPNVPTEYHPLLAQMAAVFILEAMGDTEGLTNANKTLDTMEKGVISITSDRVEGAPQKVNPRHTTLVESSGRGRRNRRNL